MGSREYLTVPEEIDRPEDFLVTGNEFVALPEIRAGDGAVLSLNVLFWGARGLLELAGTEAVPLLRVGVEGDGQGGAVAGVRRLGDWIPEVHYRFPWGDMRVTWLTPPGHKGLVVHAEVEPPAGPVTIYLEGQLGQVRRRVFTPSALAVPAVSRWHRWMRCLLWEVGSPWPFLAVAIRPAQPDARLQSRPDAGDGTQSPAVRNPGFRVSRRGRELTVMLGVGPDGDGAACQAVDLLRHGYAELRGESLRHLDGLGAEFVSGAGPAVSGPVAGGSPGDGDAAFSLWRRNLLFNYYYSRGVCLDSEELVLVTSRSPRYYVCAAHWSRDSLLWSFPALLLADRDAARQALVQAFRLYARRAGVHSLYLDGTELYPGFELDELAAFPVALGHYLERTGDRSVLEEAPVRGGMARVWDALEEARVVPHHLYRTFLLPSDDPAHHPVVTYDNVLVWKALGVFADLGWPGAREKAARLAADLRRWAVVPGPFGPMWAWSFDPPDEAREGAAPAATGRYILYDEPPGSLALLAHYGFCDALDPVYLNTLRWIWGPQNPWYAGDGPFAAPACPHARHPWVMSLANALLVPARSWQALGVDREGFLRLLCSAPMDGGLACESIDARTGRVRTGAAFATCAGLLACAVAQALRPPAPDV